jgi:hypothetical protein
VDKLVSFTDTVISRSALLPATSVATIVTVSLLCADVCFLTTVYDAQATNLDGGTIDEGITYSIKGTNADKFSITTNTGILTYAEKQTSKYWVCVIYDNTRSIFHYI